MKKVAGIGDAVTVKSFAYVRKGGGTGMSSKTWKHDEYFGPATFYITKAWHDYETGWRYHGVPHPNDKKLKDFLWENTTDDMEFQGTGLFSQFDITNIK